MTIEFKRSERSYAIRVEFELAGEGFKPDETQVHWLREAGELAVVDDLTRAEKLASSVEYLRNCLLDEYAQNPSMVGMILSISIYEMSLMSELRTVPDSVATIRGKETGLLE